jgi:hypothetical protein
VLNYAAPPRGVAAVDQHQHPAAAEPPAATLEVTVVPGQPEPPDVDRRAEPPYRETRLGPDDRLPAVAADDQIGVEDAGRAVLRPVTHADDPAVLPAQPGHLGVHP